MKRVLMVLSIVLLTISGYAQKYDKEHHYDIVSNCFIGGSVGYFHNVTTNGNNVGLDLRILKKANSWSRIRGIAEINGFVARPGFDRYGKLMAGMQIDALPFYFGFDYGFVFNNSSSSKFGMTGDVFAGLEFKRVFLEVGCDRSNNGELWQSNVFAKVGYNFSLGITEEDRMELSIKENQPIIIQEQKERNAQLQDQVNKVNLENGELRAALDKVTNLCETVSKQLEICNQNAKLVPSSTKNLVVVFEFASAEVSDIDYERLYYVAKDIIASGKHYRCEGYSSSDGSDYNNQRLSTERAEAVYNILIQHGVDEDHLSYMGNGVSYEYADGVSSLNRMVKIVEVY